MGRTRSALVLAVVAVALGGCDESRSRAGGSAPEAVDRGGLDGMLDADMMPLDAMQGDVLEPSDAIVEPSDVIPEPREGGVPVDCPIEVEFLPTDDWIGFEPIIDGATVYYTARSADGDVRTVRARDGAPIGGPSDRLLSARDGAFLLLRPDGDGRLRLIYRDGAGDVALDEDVAGPQLGGLPFWQPPQWVEPGAAIYIRGGRLFHWTGGAPARIADAVQAAALFDGHLVWVQVSGAAPMRFDLFIDGERVIGNLGTYQPGTLQLGPGGAWLAASAGIWRTGWTDDDVARWIVDGGRPIALHPDGAQAWVSLEVPGEGARGLRVGPARREAVEVARGGVWLGRSFAGELIQATWADPGAWCDVFEAGRVAVGRPGEPPMAFGEVATGCMCCGRQWPPFTLAVGDGVVAWNYAFRPAGAPQEAIEQPGVAIARFACP